MREISTRDNWGFSRMAFNTNRWLAWRKADLRSAPWVVKVTDEIEFCTYA
jgi:hypothetical protein